jgi:hypothetical protein
VIASDYLLPLREKVPAGWQADEGYFEGRLARLAACWISKALLRNTPHPTLASADKFMQSA